ncbi:uncharacterized protein K452DRAFT_292363 [Aplosporella prunicola CBS 121167]|uniref:Uncharacterized protein n=1 Tax=Aplosporella prunicola CBS 121167 TaxID=1176127 RepID=A0A6A6B089_9PEZI|nr:uncharacterized protein K452DRAFT_292363 [Aplosporella prunicola CBS 121167]KAF2136447.1 hypothetical protein K452DRAFT_292363 [Aplosporella prunicola CBS 121167]
MHRARVQLTHPMSRNALQGTIFSATPPAGEGWSSCINLFDCRPRFAFPSITLTLTGRARAFTFTFGCSVCVSLVPP